MLVDRLGSIAQVHLTLFDGDGQGLDVSAVSMSETAPTGENVEIPLTLFEPSHFAASTELEPGDWTFRVQGVGVGDRPFDVSVAMTIQ